MNEQKKLLEIQNHGSILTWSLKGASGLAGSFSWPMYLQRNISSSCEKELLINEAVPQFQPWVAGLIILATHGVIQGIMGPDHAWVDISQTGNLLAELSGLDDGFSSVTLPFDFDLYGQTYGEIFVIEWIFNLWPTFR